MAARPEGPLAFSLPLLEKDNAAAWRLLCHFLYLPGHRAETGHVAAQGLNCTSCLSPEEVARAFGSTQGVMRSRPAGPSPAPGCLGTHTAGTGRGPLGRRPRDGAGQGDPAAALTGASPGASSRSMHRATSCRGRQQQVAALSKSWQPAGWTGTHAFPQEVSRAQGTPTFHKFIVTLLERPIVLLGPRLVISHLRLALSHQNYLSHTVLSAWHGLSSSTANSPGAENTCVVSRLRERTFKRKPGASGAAGRNGGEGTGERPERLLSGFLGADAGTAPSVAVRRGSCFSLPSLSSG